MYRFPEPIVCVTAVTSAVGVQTAGQLPRQEARVRSLSARLTRPSS